MMYLMTNISNVHFSEHFWNILANESITKGSKISTKKSIDNQEKSVFKGYTI